MRKNVSEGREMAPPRKKVDFSVFKDEVDDR